MKLSKTSIALLLVQTALISSLAGKYLYERHAYPRVWTRATAFDPSLPMRGRYLSLQLTVDGCQSTLPSAKQASFPRNADNVPVPGAFNVRAPQPVYFSARLRAENGHLIALQPEGEEHARGTQTVIAFPGKSCSEMAIQQPVDFFLSEHAASPLPVHPGEELWIEVTVPRSGPPRPLQLALKTPTEWKPLRFR